MNLFPGLAMQRHWRRRTMRAAAMPRAAVLPRAAALLLAASGAALAAGATDTQPAAARALVPFEARYSVVYHGMNAGTSTMTLHRLDGDRWSYQSNSTPRGLFRLFVPDSVTQRSDMRISDSGVEPLHFSAGGDPDKAVSLDFNWQTLRVTGTDEKQKVDLPLEAGVQDDLSAQVLLMRELIAGRQPETFKTLGRKGVDVHRYEKRGTETLNTVLGPIQTVIFRSERIGSSRSSLFWCAPSLGYLPVRAQQSKGDKVEFVMELAGYKAS